MSSQWGLGWCRLGDGSSRSKWRQYGKHGPPSTVGRSRPRLVCFTQILVDDLPNGRRELANIFRTTTSRRLFCFVLFLMCFESEARGSRRNMQPSPVQVRLTVKRREQPRGSFGLSFQKKKVHGRKRGETTPFDRSLTSTSEGSAQHLPPTF